MSHASVGDLSAWSPCALVVGWGHIFKVFCLDRYTFIFWWKVNKLLLYKLGKISNLIAKEWKINTDPLCNSLKVVLTAFSKTPHNFHRVRNFLVGATEMCRPDARVLNMFKCMQQLLSWNNQKNCCCVSNPSELCYNFLQSVSGVLKICFDMRKHSPLIENFLGPCKGLKTTLMIKSY